MYIEKVVAEKLGINREDLSKVRKALPPAMHTKDGREVVLSREGLQTALVQMGVIEDGADLPEECQQALVTVHREKQQIDRESVEELTIVKTLVPGRRIVRARRINGEPVWCRVRVKRGSTPFYLKNMRIRARQVREGLWTMVGKMPTGRKDPRHRSPRRRG